MWNTEGSRDLGDCEVHPHNGNDQQEEEVESSHHQQRLLQQQDALKVVEQLQRQEVHVVRERREVDEWHSTMTCRISGFHQGLPQMGRLLPLHHYTLFCPHNC